MYSLNTLVYFIIYLLIFILYVCHPLQIMYIVCDLINNIITLYI